MGGEILWNFILFYYAISGSLDPSEISHGNRIFFQALGLEGGMGLSPRLLILLEIL